MVALHNIIIKQEECHLWRKDRILKIKFPAQRSYLMLIWKL